MAKKTRARRGVKPDKKSSAPPPEEKIEERPEVRLAAEAVTKAKQELEAAQQLYQQLRRQATEKLEALRESTFDDVLDGTRKFVKKYPGISVILGTFVGFCLGRLFQKLFRR